MKSELPKFLLLTDPYNSLEGRILVLRTDYPACIFELNRPEEPTSRVVNLYGKDYYIMIYSGWNMQFSGLNMMECQEVVRWYYYSSASGNELTTDL